MAASMDSDEEDSFVSLGNALEQINEDEPRKKLVHAQEQQAKDSRGRPRFHGAFTGGFSAGHFNSVGTKEGFRPSTFVSSRNKKHEEADQGQRPEDFMDEEDFSEYGIAPKKLVTAGKFGSQERRKRQLDEVKVMTSGTLFSGEPALADLITPERMTIGVRLLRKLGWKEGQGLGPRERRQKKRRVRSKHVFNIGQKSLDSARTGAGMKTYGCALPPPSSVGHGSGSDDSENDFPGNVTFAPKDTTPISFVAKDNVHGLGYSGLDPKVALPSTNINLFEPPRSKRNFMRGQAFGVGALEEEDEDIYATDHLSNYDITMEIDEGKEDLYGWTAPGRNKGGSQTTPVGYLGKILEGFTLSTKKLKTKRGFGPPNIPKDFRPTHKFVQAPQSVMEHLSHAPSGPEKQSGVQKTKMDAMSRAIALGESPLTGSVFDLMSDKDKSKLDAMKSTPITTSSSRVVPSTSAPTNTPVTSQNQSGSQESQQFESHRSRPDKSKEEAAEELPRSQAPLFQGGDIGFKPFAKDPAKQERYEKFIALKKLGKTDAYEEVISGHMTEWDRGHEKEEFIRASKLYKPLPGMMASRFTSAKYDDGTDTVDIPRDEGGDKTDQMKAAEMKMYGQLTHEEFEWHPHKLLCWRFNVPNPYAGSSVVGLPTVKREKYSVFNFLNFSNEPTASPNSEEMKALPAPDCPTGSKPVTFDIKNRSKMSAPLKSVFSDLMDAPASKPRPSDTEESITSTPQSTEQTEKPEQDLFNAIFGNTDSESEEDENNEGEKEEEEDDDNQSKSLNEPIQHNIDELTKHLPTSIQENVNLSESTEEKGIQERLNPPPQPPSPPEVEEEQYGPALPPPGASSTSSTAYVDLTSSSSRKYRHKDRHKDRHREKHKHKKEKKAKHKKDKHKEKKKSKKHRRRSDSSDSDSSDLEDDKELFQKLKAATQKGLLRNSDLI